MSPELDDILLHQQQQQRSNQPSVSGRKNKNKNSSRKKKKRSTAAKTQAQAQEPQTQTQTQSVVDSLGNGDGQQDGIFSVTENTSVVDNHDYGQGNMVISYLPSSGDAMEMDTPTSESSMTVGADEAVSSITSTDDFGGTERTTTPAGPLIVDSASWSGYQQPPQLPQSQYEPVAATDVGSSMSVGDMVDVVYGSDSFLEIVPPAKDEGVAEIADDGDGTENTVHPPSFDGYQSQTEFEESSCGSEKAVNESSTDSRGDDKSDLKVDAGAEKPVSYADNKALHWPRVSETRRSCSFPLGMESAADTTPAVPPRDRTEPASPGRKRVDAVDDNDDETPRMSPDITMPDTEKQSIHPARARSFNDMLSSEHCSSWGDSATEEIDSDMSSNTEPHTQGSQSDTIVKSDTTESEQNNWVIVDTARASDNQSDGDSDKTATPTTMEHPRSFEKDESADDKLDPLREYLLRIFELGQFTDSQIVLKSFNYSFPPIVFRTHRAIVARSPVIGCIFNMHDWRSTDVEIVVTAGANFTMMKAFEVALQGLYGLPVLDLERLKQATLLAIGHTEESARMNPAVVKKAKFDFAVCYAASAAFFGNHELVEAGINLAAALIDWDTIELVIHFGLLVDNFLVAYFDHIPMPDRVGEEQAQINVAAIKDLREVRAPKLLKTALEFIANNMDSGFTLYDKAHVAVMPDRIPSHLRFTVGMVLANPKLAGVKFGSFSDFEKPSHERFITSAILINLPFIQLKELLALLESKQILTEKLVLDTVQERETRRVRALEAYARQQAQNDSQGFVLDSTELGFKELAASKSTPPGSQAPAATSQIMVDREWAGLG